MKRKIYKNIQIVNEGTIQVSDLMIEDDRILKIASDISHPTAEVQDFQAQVHVFPGCIDDQVHFREPGLTHKATIFSESGAAVAGGVTSFMEMPNTIPQALTQDLLEQKFQRAAESSVANYSFFMGASNENLDELLKTNYSEVCGIKIFMGSSTGNMLVDQPNSLEAIFKNAPTIIATHCEDEKTIRQNFAHFEAQYGDQIQAQMHPLIRSREACYLSSSYAVELAKKFNSRLHVLHISTKEELSLFNNQIPLDQKRITAEACVHHLYFNDQDYSELGNWIKCNPAIKTKEDQTAIQTALSNGTIDVVATDHAPHTIEEKKQIYAKSPSGLPLIQYSLPMMLELAQSNYWSLPFVAEKMAHNPAILFRIKERGFIREGYFADLAFVDLQKETRVSPETLLYKCGWSPLNQHLFQSKVTKTLVNGHEVWDGEKLMRTRNGKRLLFAQTH